MRLGFILMTIVLCGVCSALPTDGGTNSGVTTATAAGSASAVVETSVAAPLVVKPTGESQSRDSQSFDGDDEDDDEDDDDDESQMGGGGLNLPLSSALLLSTHHGHHICLPDVVAYSLLGARNYPLGGLFPYHHSSSQRLQQELMFLKAFTKAGQHVWKAIASGHGKSSHHALGNFAKVISNGVNVFTGKGEHEANGSVGGVHNAQTAAGQNQGAAVQNQGAALQA